MILEGNDDSETFSYVEISVNPCKSNDKNCVFYYSVVSSTDVSRIDEYIANNPQLDPTEKAKFDTSVASTDDRATAFLEFIEKEIKKEFEDMTITLSYIEGAIDVYDYDDPYNLIMTQRIKVHPTIDYQKRIHVYFRIIETNTDKGHIRENFTTQYSIGLDTLFMDAADRGFSSTNTKKKPGDSDKQEYATPLMVFNLYSSNNKLVYTRKYTNLLDVGSNVGGVAYIAFVTIILIYGQYNQLKMKQDLLNYGILNHDDSKVKHLEEISDWEKKRFFNFFEVFKFSYFGACIGCIRVNKAKQELFRKCEELLEQRLDIIEMMESNQNLRTFENALFKPYQIKLLYYTFENDPIKKSQRFKYSLKKSVYLLKESTQNALNEDEEKTLNYNDNESESRGTKEQSQQSQIGKKIDEFLNKKLSRDILDGKFETSGDINKQKNKHKEAERTWKLNQVYPNNNQEIENQ